MRTFRHGSPVPQAAVSNRSKATSLFDDLIGARKQRGGTSAQLVEQRAHQRRSARIGVQDTDAIGPAVLRTRGERPRSRRAAEKGDELAAL